MYEAEANAKIWPRGLQSCVFFLTISEKSSQHWTTCSCVYRYTKSQTYNLHIVNFQMCQITVHWSEPYKNGWTNRGAAGMWRWELSEPKGLDPGRDNFGGNLPATVKHAEHTNMWLEPCKHGSILVRMWTHSVQRMTDKVHIRATWRIGLNNPCRLRCTLTSNYCDHLLVFLENGAHGISSLNDRLN